MASAVTAGSQAPASLPGQVPTLTVNARIVVLDVVVTDAAGNIVTSLKREDFSIYEDGVLQPIRSFQAPGTGQLPPEFVG